MDGYAYLIGGNSPSAGSLRGVIEGALEALNLESRPWTEDARTGLATVSMVEQIREAAVILADIREGNPNVYYEVGLAHALNRPVVTFIGEDETPRFDLEADRAIPVRFNGDEVASRDLIRGAVKRSILSAMSTEPATAFRFAELREEVPRLRATVADLERQLVDLDSSRSRAPDEGPAWRDLALAGRLPQLGVEHLSHDVRVVHVDLGVGRITGWSPASSSPVTIEIRFADGDAGFPLPSPRLFFAAVDALAKGNVPTPE